MPLQLSGSEDACRPAPPIRDFPASIRLALARAAGCDGGGLEQLAAGERALLVRLVRNVSAAMPEDSVRIANPTLATALHVSERTIHRLKGGLEAKGWITRRQVQSRRRGMQISDVWLTRHALETLGLACPVATDVATRPAPVRPQRPPGMADALQIPQSVSQRPPCGDPMVPRNEAALPSRPGLSADGGAPGNASEQETAEDEACTIEENRRPKLATSAPSDRDTASADTWLNIGRSGGMPVQGTASMREPEARHEAPGSHRSLPQAVLATAAPCAPGAEATSGLPDDVQVLAGKGGVTLAGVRLLMGLATKAGTRLGHVLQVAGDAVLGSRKPFAYVQKLLRTGRDWSTLATTAQRLQEEARHVRATVSDLDQLRVALAEGLYSHAKRRFVWRVEFGAVHQSTVEDAVRGGIGRWLVLHDVSGLATAWRDGRIFRVEQATIEEWSRVSAKELQHAGQHPPLPDDPTVGSRCRQARPARPRGSLRGPHGQPA